jgi:hypothetical protein
MCSLDTVVRVAAKGTKYSHDLAAPVAAARAPAVSRKRFAGTGRQIWRPNTAAQRIKYVMLRAWFERSSIHSPVQRRRSGVLDEHLDIQTSGGRGFGVESSARMSLLVSGYRLFIGLELRQYSIDQDARHLWGRCEKYDKRLKGTIDPNV